MKKGALFTGMLVMVLAFGMSVVGCNNPANGGGTGNGTTTSANDPFAGTWVIDETWINEVGALRIVASNGSWRQYLGEFENIRGSYTFSGNIVTVSIGTVNTALIGGADQWVFWGSLSPVQQQSIGSQTVTATVSGNSIIVAGLSFTRQYGGGTGAIYDPTGTWGFSVSGQSATVIVYGNNWVFTVPVVVAGDDYGTFTRNGNVAALFSSSRQAVIGTATMTSATTMVLTLVSPSAITGIFHGTLSN